MAEWWRMFPTYFLLTRDTVDPERPGKDADCLADNDVLDPRVWRAAPWHDLEARIGAESVG
jgi:hypothetical protein